MFKNDEQIKTFVDMTEKFVRSIINNQLTPGAVEAGNLNKHRDAYEKFLGAISGLTSSSNTTDVMVCPDCGADMALRTNRTNGNKFWGCKKYPNCKGTRDENGLSKQDREDAKIKQEEVAQTNGFSFNRDKRNPVTEVQPPSADTGWVNPFAKNG